MSRGGDSIGGEPGRQVLFGGAVALLVLGQGEKWIFEIRARQGRLEVAELPDCDAAQGFGRPRWGRSGSEWVVIRTR